MPGTGPYVRAHDVYIAPENRSQACAAPGDLRLGRFPEDSGAFCHFRYVNPAVTSVAAQPPGHLLIARVINGRFLRDTAGTSERFGPGDVFVVSEPHQPFAFRPAGAHLDLIGIRLAAVADATGDPSMSVPGRLRLRGYRPVSPAAARRWNSTADFAVQQLANHEASAGPLITPRVAALLAASALATFPNNAVSDPDPDQRRDAHPPTLQLAVAFIDAHVSEPISAADIAAAAFVTVRAIQLAFRRHLDTTPLEYLRSVRLERAHADLTAADCSQTSVTAIAYRWGFPSPSRFSAIYRRVYGITPGKTLQYSRSQPSG